MCVDLNSLVGPDMAAATQLKNGMWFVHWTLSVFEIYYVSILMPSARCYITTDLVVGELEFETECTLNFEYAEHDFKLSRRK